MYRGVKAVQIGENMYFSVTDYVHQFSPKDKPWELSENKIKVIQSGENIDLGDSKKFVVFNGESFLAISYFPAN
ncbi:hypothetical protein D3C87_2155010 [compost metagenome]